MYLFISIFLYFDELISWFIKWWQVCWQPATLHDLQTANVRGVELYYDLIRICLKFDHHLLQILSGFLSDCVSFLHCEYCKYDKRFTWHFIKFPSEFIMISFRFLIANNVIFYEQSCKPQRCASLKLIIIFQRCCRVHLKISSNLQSVKTHRSCNLALVVINTLFPQSF